MNLKTQNKWSIIFILNRMMFLNAKAVHVTNGLFIDKTTEYKMLERENYCPYCENEKLLITSLKDMVTNQNEMKR